MKVLFINATCGIGSHGRISGELAEELENQGNICKIAYGRGCSERFSRFGYQIGNKISVYTDVVATRLFDAHEYTCVHATRKFLMWADEYDPDLLWLHNIHGYYINYKMLFDWIKTRPGMEVKWTLHDCWAITGHCGFFTMNKCDKWKSGCSRCSIYKDYPKSLLFDNSRANYNRKKEAFRGVNKMTLITPSQWLADLTRDSFLCDYPVEVINNEIDSNIFKPTKSRFREQNKLENKTIILGVANVWHKRKGLDDFIELARPLNDEYCLVLVGMTNFQIKAFEQHAIGIQKIYSEHGHLFRIAGGEIPPKSKYQDVKRTEQGVVIVPDIVALYNEITKGKTIQPTGTSVILIARTESAQELAGLYTTADYYVNPTREDNYPTTNLEAQACGTFIITYDVGGSKETIK